MSRATTISITDDDPDDLGILQLIIKEVAPSTQFQTFTDGNLLLQFLNACPDSNLPHLIVLDYNMDPMKGTDILVALQRQERLTNISKVIWSTSDVSKFKEESIRCGASAYFVKPYGLNEMRMLAKQLLRFCEDV